MSLMSLTAVELGKKIKAGEVTVRKLPFGKLWTRYDAKEEHGQQFCDSGREKVRLKARRRSTETDR